MDEITINEAATYLRIHRATAVRWAKAGRIAGAYLPRRSRRIGYRMPRQSVLDLLEEEERVTLQDRLPA
jgi:excisionase family DNA binding protein